MIFVYIRDIHVYTCIFMWFLCRKTHVWWEKTVGFSVGFSPNNPHTVEVVKFLDTHNNAHNGQRNIDATWHRVSWDDWTVRQSVVNYFVQPCYWDFVCVPWPSWYPQKNEFSHVPLFLTILGTLWGSRCTYRYTRICTHTSRHFEQPDLDPRLGSLGWLAILAGRGIRDQWTQWTHSHGPLDIAGPWIDAVFGYFEDVLRLKECRFLGRWQDMASANTHEVVKHVQIHGTECFKCLWLTCGSIWGIPTWHSNRRFAKQQIPLGPWMKRSVPSIRSWQEPHGKQWLAVPFLVVFGLEWLSWLMTTLGLYGII